MDWFKQNKIAIGAALASIVASVQGSGLFPDPRAVLVLNILGTLAGMIAGAGMNVKSDKQEKVESVLGPVPTRRLTDK